MRRDCDACGQIYDDLDHWTFCPHDYFPPAQLWYPTNRVDHVAGMTFAPPSPTDDRYRSPALFAAACRLVEIASTAGVILSPYEASLVIRWAPMGDVLAPDEIVDRLALDFARDPGWHA